MGRILHAMSAFWAALARGEEAVKIVPVVAAEGEVVVLPDGMQVLAMFQEKSRLVDFLMEEIDSYDDAQVGAAVRSIHRSAHEALVKYFSPSPLLQNAEGDTLKIEKGFDPLKMRLTGNVAGEPPFDGILHHPGWKAGAINLPPRNSRGGGEIISPAEIEIS
jgi:hypothetical protein